MVGVVFVVRVHSVACGFGVSVPVVVTFGCFNDDVRVVC